MDAIELDLAKTVGNAIKAAIQTEAVRIACSAYLEGRGLDGEWGLEITGARLVPLPKAE